jgi:hypothetical protein
VDSTCHDRNHPQRCERAELAPVDGDLKKLRAEIAAWEEDRAKLLADIGA